MHVRRWPSGRRSRRTSTLVPAALVLALVSAFGSPVPAAHADLLDEKWTELRSENFTVFSLVSERKSRALLHDLERFRLVCLALAGGQDASLPVPSRILLIERQDQWKSLGLSPEMPGVFFDTPRQSLITMLANSGNFDVAVIQHEYVHQLQARRSTLIPHWYQEGFAEFLSTVRTRDEFVDIGRVSDRRIGEMAALTWLPVRRLIDPVSYSEWTLEERSMFYAESWLLVHFLIAGGDYKDSFSERLGKYLAAVEAGTDGVAAFEAAFEVEVGSLDRKLRQYVERGRFPGFALPAERFEPKGTITAGPASPVDIAITIGTLQLAMGRHAEARAAFERAVALDDKHAQAHAGLGRALALAGQTAEADKSLERARALAPDDLSVMLDAAGLLLEHADATDADTTRAWDVERARRLLVTAWKQDKERPETYWLYGRSYLLLGDDDVRAVQMLEAAQRLVPTSTSVRLDLAEAYLAAERPADAAAMARSVIAWSHDDVKSSERAREILSRIPATPSATPAAGAAVRPPTAP